MIEIKNKQIIIDGKPTLIMCGEIHYYRLNRKDWQDRIDNLKEAGCNAVATYVPWLCHEPVEGQFDLDGHTRPELDLGGFIDLCAKNDLYFFVRPGPFIMAEMKNEGIPYWVAKKHPEIVPLGWDGNDATTPTLDYLAPGFLAETKKWYKEVMGVIAPRLHTNNGNIIGVQLDNEIGMLSWVSNCPDLTDHVIEDFSGWLMEEYEAAILAERYPFDLAEHEVRVEKFRSPSEDYAPELLRDLGHYMRNRFARYVAILRNYAEEFGVKDVPFIVNIHGTGGGRGLTYPIGISQLYESYTQDEGYLSGSDIYFGDLDVTTFQDLYLINGFMDAVHNPDQPLTSVEFNCGDGNFGETYGARYDVSAADFKTRMCVAQGNRLINYYLFTGGYNYQIEEAAGDGNGRIASTGERHGFAAPVNPEGKLNYTFPRMARSIKTMMAVGDKLAGMDEERDEVAFAFIPDYYMTEYRYPKSAKMKEIIDNVTMHRGAGAWELVARAMLLANYRFGSVDIQNKELNPDTTRSIVVPSARYMDREVQEKLVQYVENGGGLFLYGEVPTFDMEGKPFTALADALGVEPVGVTFNHHGHNMSLTAEAWAAPRPEIRTYFTQTFKTADGVVPFMRVTETNDICGFESTVGKGKAIVLAAAYRCDLDFVEKALGRLGAKAGLTHDCEYHGIFSTSVAAEGERFIHLLNLDGFDKDIQLTFQGEKLLGGRRFTLQSKDGVMLPMNVSYHDVTIAYSTAEVLKVEKDSFEFRLTQSADTICLETAREVAESESYSVEMLDGKILITSKKHAKVDDKLVVYFS
ncbi:Beta-galactosidase precursor [Bacillus sp. THAF10]|uniref:beta-galactosidase n=1 Tax=Bacillus sp. THAF10 TaxID=2587848 RepID=UPI001268F116|nr:alpha-amylase family protein [Bacillus sp. THAF10]QFT90521.1 Beta-galactosidase precursor [Bacillus sp. THAF10]